MQNKNTTLWTDGKAAEIIVSAENRGITARDGVKLTEASGAKDTISNHTNDSPLAGVAMAVNGDLSGLPENSGFTIGLVSGEDLIALSGWGANRKAGEVINAFSALFNQTVTDKGYGRLTVDKALLFSAVPTSYQSRYSLAAVKVLNNKAVTVTEGAPVHISVTRAESGKYIVKATAPGELNENAVYRINYGAYGYGKLAFVTGWYLSGSEIVLIDGYSVGVKAPN